MRKHGHSNRREKMVTPRFAFDGASFNLISATITAVQKCAFVLYVGVCLINGTTFNFFNKYLIPDREDKSWLGSLFNFEHLDDCSSLWNIYLSHRCINALLVIDDTEVLRAISGMSPFYKWHYLVIVRGSKVLVPYLFQISLLLTFVVMGILVLSAITKALQAFGIETPWTRLLFEETSVVSRRSSVIGLYHLAVIPGFLFASYVVCNLAPVSDNKGCDNPWNMYCVTSLSRTVFKSKSDPAFPSDKDIRFFATLGIILSSVILTVLIYYATVLCLCLGIYIAMDAVSNVWDTGYVLSENISRSSPTVIQSTWNQYMPNFKDLCSRILQMKRNHRST